MVSRVLLKSLLGVSIAALAVGVVLLFSQPAQAAVYTLNNWNETNLDASDDFVQVTTECGAANKICVQWFEGATVEGPAAIGIDQFFYDVDGTGDNDSVVPKITSEDDATATWSFNFDGETADGFGTFDSQKSSGPGGSSLFITFTLDGGTAALNNFAVHVRYNNECSGWASNRTADSQVTIAGCAANGNGGETEEVPEPLAALLLGAGLAGAMLGVKKLEPAVRV